MKKLKTIYSIFFLCFINFLFINNISYSENKENNKIKDYAAKYRLEKEIDTNLELFFAAIRSKKNTYVKLHLKTDENLKNRENIQKSSETNEYKPGEDMSLMPNSDIILIDVNAKDKYGYTPIIVAIESGNNEILKLLLDNGANIMEEHPVFGRLTLHTAAYYENEEAVDMLIKYDSSLVNAQSGTDGWTPLQDATLKSNVKIVKKLLDSGANPLIKDYTGGSAVDMATEFGKGQIVKLLRDNIKKSRGE